MLLGVYWYYGFPEDLYRFDFFRFCPGFGGHADGPAELTVTVQAPDPAALLAQVRAVAARYPDGYLFAYAHTTQLRLTLGDYALTDYTFHVAQELEQVLHQQQATPTAEPLPTDTPLLRLAEPQDPTPPYRYNPVLQAVAAGPQKHRAEVALLRLDCHLPLVRQPDFLTTLAALCEQFNLDVLYYYDYIITPQVNLMVFFSNGRQGVGGQPLRYTDTAALTTAVAASLAAHGGRPKHLGKQKEYPRHGPHIIRMVDIDFVL
ncbi:hypothetical protein DNI29_17720 [Hymenobacter sediminis]|uniref:hypothetical protein n=1 Tax=Hymenobacter sediminis TaxID=2218621 RepID=UPI000DA68C76|nr:hypothetical protein [Hymenobacter sediminis]RPD45231.1 hypothetical protein DNI29_17720 [Hymenobacter sediminis]